MPQTAQLQWFLGDKERWKDSSLSCPVIHTSCFCHCDKVSNRNHIMGGQLFWVTFQRDFSLLWGGGLVAEAPPSEGSECMQTPQRNRQEP